MDTLWELDSDETHQGHSSAARNHVYKTNSLLHEHSTWPLPVADLVEGPGKPGAPPVFCVKKKKSQQEEKPAGHAKRVVDVLGKLREQKSYLRAKERLFFTKT